MIQSVVKNIGPVSFPEFTGERVYMKSFTKKLGLPSSLRRWQPTVDQMLSGVDTKETMYLMIDQSEVRAGSSQRRSGIHMDGYWDPSINNHRQPGHRGSPSHIMSRSFVDPDKSPSDWHSEVLMNPGAVLLASDVMGCRSYMGEWQGVPGQGGDCSHIDVSSMLRMNMKPNFTYAGNVTMLHESIPLQNNRTRTLVRINVPGLTV